MKELDDVTALHLGALKKSIDELRKSMQEKPESEAKEPKDDKGTMRLVTQVAAIMERQLQAQLEPLRAAIEAQMQGDALAGSVRELVEENRQLRECIDELTAAVTKDSAKDQAVAQGLGELIAVLKAPRKRTGIVELPSGKVQMTVTEH